MYLRAATAYGVSPLLRFDLAVNNLVAWAATTGQVYLKSLGTSWRPLVHIEDIALAYITLLHAPEAKVHNRAFNIGRTEENYRIRDVAEIVRRTVPKTTHRVRAGRLARSAQLPGQLRARSRASCPNTGRTGRSRKGSRRSTGGSSSGTCTATTSRARATTGSRI